MLANGSYTLDGFEVKLIHEIAKTLNFDPAIECIDKEYGVIFEANSTATGNFRHAITGNADMILGSVFLNSIRNKVMSPTEPYQIDFTKLVAPRTSAFSPLEKLLRPFDHALLSAVLVTVIGGVFVVHAIRKLVRCEDRSMNPFNVVSVFLCGPQPSSPDKVPLRILFIAFSFVCMVIRTVYQGSLFSLIQAEEFKKGLSNLDDMVDAGYSFYVSNTFGQSTSNLKFHDR
jgi:hypothetical protein